MPQAFAFYIGLAMLFEDMWGREVRGGVSGGQGKGWVGAWNAGGEGAAASNAWMTCGVSRQLDLSSPDSPPSNHTQMCTTLPLNPSAGPAPLLHQGLQEARQAAVPARQR